MITMLQITQPMVQHTCPNRCRLPMLSNPSPASSKQWNMADKHTLAGLPLELLRHNSSGPSVCLYYTAFLKATGRENPAQTSQSMAVLKQSQWDSHAQPWYSTFSLTCISKSQEHDRAIIKLILHQSGTFSLPARFWEQPRQILYW